MTLRFFGFKSLTARLLAIYIPLVTIGLVALIVFINVRDFVADRDALAGQIETIARVNASVLADRLWELDNDGIAKIAAELARSPRIRHVGIHDETGKLVAAAGGTEESGGGRKLRIEEDLSYAGDDLWDEDDDPGPLGRLVIIADTGQIDDHLTESLSVDLAILVTTLVLLVGATWIATRIVIGRPLGLLRQSILDRQPGEIADLVTWSGDDELGEVIDAYNEMLVKMTADDAALKTANETLEAQVARRTQALAENQRLLNGVVDSSAAAIYIKDVDGRYLLTNRGWEEALGVNAETALGQRDDEIFDPAVAETWIANDRAVLESGERLEFEETVPGPGGEQTFMSHKFPLFTDTGEIAGVCGISVDISELKDVQNQLGEARDAAEAANRAKSGFLAAMSHEIRTPMNGVVGMMELLGETQLDTDQRQMMTTVRESAYSLQRIIDDILDFSKIEADRMQIEEAPISVTEAIEGVAASLVPNAAKKDLLLLCFADPEIPDHVMGDRVRLRQILYNLTGNAVKFTDTSADRRGKVMIRADRLDGAGDGYVRVRYSVIDNGIGISAAGQEALFQPFSQVDSNLTSQFGGTGLGLSITKKLTEMMGGTVTVESERGAGSVFTATIDHQVAPVEQNIASARDLTGVNVLIVSEIAEGRELQSVYLQHHGAEVAWVDNLDDAKETLRTATAAGAPFHSVVLGTDCPPAKAVAFSDQVESDEKLGAPNFVVVARGRRRFARKGGDNIITIDGAPIQRANFITAVAASVGRASPETKKLVEWQKIGRAEAPSIEDAVNAGQLILVAEDNLTNQDVIRRQLDILGYAAEVADNGKQALEMLETGRYDLLLTDCHMPVMDGYDLAGAVRAREAKDDGRHLPIIAITANALHGEADRCIAAGMDDYLAKPVELAKIKQKLLQWMPAADGTQDAASDDDVDTPVDTDAETDAETGPENSAPTKAESAVFDAAALSVLVGDDPDMIRDILSDFVVHARENVGEIETAFRGGSGEAVGAAAHKLKSSARATGAMALADLCERLEKAGKTESWETVQAGVPRLSNMLEEVVTRIEAL